MLPPPYKWRISEDRAFLDWNAGNVAHVQAWRGQLTLTIRWQGKTVGGPVGSSAQGVRYAERWLQARPGLPGLGAKHRWYDEIDARRRAGLPIRW